VYVNVGRPQETNSTTKSHEDPKIFLFSFVLFVPVGGTWDTSLKRDLVQFCPEDRYRTVSGRIHIDPATSDKEVMVWQSR
jgi:hypothetical protein